jgi:hypothetical protein
MDSKNLIGLYESYRSVYKETDDIVDYLLSEGFAETTQSAAIIKEYMSENWLNSILEEFKKLTPEKEKRVRKVKDQLFQKAIDHNKEKWDNKDEYDRMNNGRRKRFDPKLKEPEKRACEHERQVKKTVKLMKNAQLALSRTKE